MPQQGSSSGHRKKKAQVLVIHRAVFSFLGDALMGGFLDKLLKFCFLAFNGRNPLRDHLLLAAAFLQDLLQSGIVDTETDMMIFQRMPE